MLSGCASTAHNPQDPLEPLNRAVYKFNDGFDRVLLKPAATVYKTVLPQFVRTGVTNFFNNLYDILVALNNLLQGKLPQAVSDVGRVAVNTTVGIGGLFDVGTKIGLEKHNEDFGQTLGVWGIHDGPYLQLPFFGPSSFRDALGLAVDFQGDPVRWLWNHDVPTRNSLWGLNIVSKRANLLDTTDLLEDAALDPYEYQRDAYLQNRRSKVYDGNPPPDNRSELDDLYPLPKPAALPTPDKDVSAPEAMPSIQAAQLPTTSFSSTAQ
jgi:phospholipid-binding lipoprotein MlaA